MYRLKHTLLCKPKKNERNIFSGSHLGDVEKRCQKHEYFYNSIFLKIVIIAILIEIFSPEGLVEWRNIWVTFHRTGEYSLCEN